MSLWHRHHKLVCIFLLPLLPSTSIPSILNHWQGTYGCVRDAGGVCVSPMVPFRLHHLTLWLQERRNDHFELLQVTFKHQHMPLQLTTMPAWHALKLQIPVSFPSALRVPNDVRVLLKQEHLDYLWDQFKWSSVVWTELDTRQCYHFFLCVVLIECCVLLMYHVNWNCKMWW